MSRSSSSIHPLLQLTRDETRILQECDREALMYRSLPYSVFTFVAIQYAMSKNIISTKAKWIKIVGSVFASYMIGKFSYAMACQKRILKEIPDSNLAKLIRGNENRQQFNVDINKQQEKSTDDLNKTAVIISDTNLESVDINQYGDSIYKTTK